MASRTLRLTAALALPLLAAACLQDDGRRFNPLRDRFETSVEEERELGFRFDRDARRQLPLIDDLAVLEFVHELGQEVVRRVGPQPFVYRFRVVKDPNLNAFAVPGGFVYLHSGTVLSAASVAELVGVIAHEVAHVKARHYARLVEQAAIPNLLTSLAGIAAAVATGEPGLAVTAQALNVALQLRYTREFEAEADRLGATFMSRAGYPPEGMVRFFERIVLAQRATPAQIPPYLYTHPDVDQRIATVSDLATGLQPRHPPDRDHGAQLRSAQARLGLLVDTDRSALATGVPFDRSRNEQILARAEARAEAGDETEALAILEAGEKQAGPDPRLPFRRAQLLEAGGRLDEAVAAYRRAVDLDPSRALSLRALGRAHQARGHVAEAIFFLEQAERRAAPGRGLRERVAWEIEKLSFPVIAEAGLADGARSKAADTVAGTSREEFGPSDGRVVWWGRLGTHFLGHRELVRVRWIDPEGEVVLEEGVRARQRTYGVSTLRLEEAPRRLPGRWTVEVRFDDDLVDRRTFRLQD